ncbi:MAG TPA: ABC transporter ATP-binding protein [Clostridia bacterium]|nr:ABC transporter ATP-binding protein [Clostridia bacterium]
MNGAIEIKDLSVSFMLPGAMVRAVDNVSVRFEEGRITGLIGESGCGKSVLGAAILGLLPPYARVTGDIFLGEYALLEKSAVMHRLLGAQIGVIPQSPSESLNPARTVAAHIYEAQNPLRLPRQEKKKRAMDLLENFGFERVERILKAFPHELSGGMQQRVLCAIGSACSPEWILADEPTKGLDRTLCDRAAETLLSLKPRGVKSMLVITHDLELASKLCDTVAVMYSGMIVEMGDALQNPLHPYTQAFLKALPQNGMNPIAQVLDSYETIGCCPFAPRCAVSRPMCFKQCPPPFGDDKHWVRCFNYAG